MEIENMSVAIIQLIGTVIVGLLSFLGVVITNITNNKKVENKIVTAQAVTDTKLENLTREVNKHNNFAGRVPVIEEQIKVINHRLHSLEEK